MTCFHLVAHILSETCQVEPHQRRNCGHPGITAKECKEKGCCFDNTVRGVPWCFYTELMGEEGRALSTPQSLNTRDHGTQYKLPAVFLPRVMPWGDEEDVVLPKSM